MIAKWNGSAYGAKTYQPCPDIWGRVQTKNNDGWFVPSKDEWSAFAAFLKDNKSLTTSNYSYVFGLTLSYWSSSQSGSTYSWRASFSNGYCHTEKVNDESWGRVRLAMSF